MLRILSKIGDFISVLRTWWRYSRNRKYFHYVMTAVTSVPFDYNSFMDIQHAYLRFMLDYMEKRLYTTDETYDEIIRWLKLAISLNDIIAGKGDLFRYDGDVKFEDIGNGMSRLDTSGLVYHCDVKVNVSNAARFIKNEKARKWAVEHPHELYLEKAKHLYFKILREHFERWWD